MFKNLSYITRTDLNTKQMALPEGKRKIFISYKHSDEAELPLCEKIASYILNELDVAIWYDHKLTAGGEYDEEIQKAISQSDVFILLLTPNIIDSEYVLQQEVPFAIKNQVSIIPVIAGISEENIANVEKFVGRVHMPVWFFDKQTQVKELSKDAKEQFINGLKLAIANKDLISQAKLFYEKGFQNLSLRYLTAEQMFVKAYGNLFGIDADSDKSVGIRLMESILSMHEGDAEFAELQEQVSHELLKHFYRTNQPELFLPYAKTAVARKYKQAFPLLFDMFRTQWNKDILRNEAEISLAVFEHVYEKNFGIKWDADVIIKKSKREQLHIFTSEKNNLPHVGEIVFDGHTAYFQRSASKEKTVNFIIDGQCVGEYDISMGFGSVSFLFAAYDEARHMLITLYADFDHYGPETFTEGKIYHFDGEEIACYTFNSDWEKGMRQLPYSPRTFNIG